MKKQFRDFESAREFARTLKLKYQKEWIEYCKSGDKPDNVPAAPEHVYKNKGWSGIGDWLGTGTIAPKNKVYRTFTEARQFVQKLELTSLREWIAYCKSGNKPDDIPQKVERTYKNDFKGYGDFLGTGTIAPQNLKFLPFKDARDRARKLGLKSQTEWFDSRKSGSIPDNISASPHKTYKNKGWISWGDWLGTGRIADQLKEFKNFEDAKIFVRSLGLKGHNEWMDYRKSSNKPVDIPTNPNVVYKEWLDLDDWLGLEKIEYRSFSEAKEFVKKLNLNSQTYWYQYSKSGNKPDNIPNSPHSIYKKEWKSWGDFLGSGVIANSKKDFKTYEETKQVISSLNLTTQKEFKTYSMSGNKPDDIPASPNEHYKNKGWISWGAFLGTNSISSVQQHKNYLPYLEAKKLVHQIAKIHNIKSHEDWHNAVKKGLIPDNIPANPWSTYPRMKRKNDKK
jgi:hypothetical protein